MEIQQQILFLQKVQKTLFYVWVFSEFLKSFPSCEVYSKSKNKYEKLVNFFPKLYQNKLKCYLFAGPGFEIHLTLEIILEFQSTQEKFSIPGYVETWDVFQK